MKKKIKIYDLVIFILIISLFKFTFIPSIILKIFKATSICISFLYIVRNVKKTKMFFNVTLLLTLSIIISSVYGYYYQSIDVSNLIYGWIYAVIIYCLFIMIGYGIDKNLEENLLNVLYTTFKYIYIFSLFFIMHKGSNNEFELIYYFVGNKFMTTYCMIFFVILYAIKFNIHRKKIRFFIIILLTIILCKYLNCTTSFVASFLLILCYMKPNKRIAKILMNKNTLIIALISSVLIIIFLSSILKNEYIAYFIVDILNEDLSLTGRIKIYDSVKYVISNSPILGYGYGNYAIGNVVGYGNAQNAVFEYISSYGLIGLIIFIKLYYNAFSCSRNNDSQDFKFKWPMYIYIYIMVISGIVEISFNYLFFLALFIIYWINNKQFKNNKLGGIYEK